MSIRQGSRFTVTTRYCERIGIRRERKARTFFLANGQQVTRGVGFVIVRADGSFTIDEVVFAESGDRALLGARSLEGLNLTVDPTGRRVIPSGPTPAATPVTVRRAPASVRRR